MQCSALKKEYYSEWKYIEVKFPPVYSVSLCCAIECTKILSVTVYYSTVHTALQYKASHYSAIQHIELQRRVKFSAVMAHLNVECSVEKCSIACIVSS